MRTTLRKTIYDKVAARWADLGLPGTAPEVRAFESEEKFTYQEEGQHTM